MSLNAHYSDMTNVMSLCCLQRRCLCKVCMIGCVNGACVCVCVCVCVVCVCVCVFLCLCLCVYAVPDDRQRKAVESLTTITHTHTHTHTHTPTHTHPPTVLIRSAMHCTRVTMYVTQPDTREETIKKEDSASNSEAWSDYGIYNFPYRWCFSDGPVCLYPFENS